MDSSNDPFSITDIHDPRLTDFPKYHGFDLLHIHPRISSDSYYVRLRNSLVILNSIRDYDFNYLSLNNHLLHIGLDKILHQDFNIINLFVQYHPSSIQFIDYSVLSYDQIKNIYQNIISKMYKHWSIIIHIDFTKLNYSDLVNFYNIILNQYKDRPSKYNRFKFHRHFHSFLYLLHYDDRLKFIINIIEYCYDFIELFEYSLLNYDDLLAIIWFVIKKDIGKSYYIKFDKLKDNDISVIIDFIIDIDPSIIGNGRIINKLDDDYLEYIINICIEKDINVINDFLIYPKSAKFITRENAIKFIQTRSYISSHVIIDRFGIDFEIFENIIKQDDYEIYTILNNEKITDLSIDQRRQLFNIAIENNSDNYELLERNKFIKILDFNDNDIEYYQLMIVNKDKSNIKIINNPKPKVLKLLDDEDIKKYTRIKYCPIEYININENKLANIPQIK